MNTIINEELNKMKYLLGYQRGKVVSEQALVSSTNTTPAATVEDVVKQIQTILNTKYGTKLAVDGKWGNLTQTAFETAIKSKATTPKATGEITPPSMTGTTATTTPAAAPTTPAAAPTTPAAAPTTPAAAPTPEEVVATDVTQPTRRDQRRERQDLRRSNRRAMQDLRTQQRAQ